MIGKRILSYEIKKLLGEGGMGNVYLAEHITNGEKVAIKSLLPQLMKHESIRERFKMEADTLSRLPHPHIVKLISYREDTESAYIIMEYAEGMDLSNHINNHSGPMPTEKALFLMGQILDAIGFAHKNDVIHRDIKPSNIILTNDGNIKIIDFGIAKVLSEEDRKLTKTGLQMGAVFYMSPEQVRGKTVDKRSDIYSLGVTFFQMVSGQSPYKSLTTEYEVYSKIVNEPLPSVGSIYPGAFLPFDNVIAKATEKDPVLRFDDCPQFAKALTDAVAGGGITGGGGSGGSGGGTKKDSDKKKSKAPVLIACIIILLVLVAGGGWQCSLQSDYKRLLSEAQAEYQMQQYTAAIDLYQQADEKGKSLFICKGDDNIKSDMDKCYFELYRNKGEELLKDDRFSVSNASVDQFPALDEFQKATLYNSSDDYVNARITLCQNIQSAMKNYKDREFIDAASDYDKAISYANQINEGTDVLSHLNQARAIVPPPSGKFVNITTESGAFDGDLRGLKMDFELETLYLKNKSCSITVYFYYYETGMPVTKSDGKYTTAEGAVAISDTFTPPYESTTYPSIKIFLPYSELASPYSPTTYYKYNAVVTYNGRAIFRSSDQYFSY